jgi:hypothetical protein
MEIVAYGARINGLSQHIYSELILGIPPRSTFVHGE